MFKNYKEPCCIEFYNAYDSILKNMGFHAQFFFFFKTKFGETQSIEYAHKVVVESFIDFIKFEKFDPQIISQEETKKRSSLSKKIFDFCYRTFFKVSSTPSNSSELKQSLFESELKCLKLFENVNRCLFSNDFSSDDKELLQNLIKQFIFVRTFSSFIYKYRRIESVEFFKRFFFIYPFDREDTPCDYNREWLENHNQKFETIKNYIDSPADELHNVREWFKEQLDKVDFAKLSEENKSIFFKEMFVAFGNVSSEKTGDVKGFRVPLNNLFYLGRYYNVQLLPLLYVKKERSTLELIAHETWRRICKLKLTTKDEIEEAKRKNISGKMSEPSEKELYGKKAPKVDIKRLMTQFSNPTPIEQDDNYESLTTKLVSGFDVSRIPEIKSVQEVPRYIADTLGALGVNTEKVKSISNLGKIKIPEIKSTKQIPESIFDILDAMSEKGYVDADYREGLKRDLLGPKINILKIMGDAGISLSAVLSVQKSGVGLLTHFDMRELQTSPREMQKVVEDIVRRLG
jgi:hypothetical protein